jgi:hypothetical protein
LRPDPILFGKYAYEHDLFTPDIKSMIGQLLPMLTDPEVIQSLLLHLVAAGLKKLAGKFAKGAVPVAGTAASVYEGAQLAIGGFELKVALDDVTYKSDIKDLAPKVAGILTNLILELGFAQLLKKIKCFAAGTQIAVAMSRGEDGSWKYATKSIEDLRGVEEAGDDADWVLAREELGDKVELRRVLRTVKHSSDHLRVLEFEDATGQRQTIRTTDEHPFWVVDTSEARGRYIPAQHLEVGQPLTGPNGERPTLIASRRESHPDGVPVYNFEVEDFHTYFVASEKGSMSPILTHNQQECFRGMKEGDDGLPERGTDGRTLGARPNRDIPVQNGMVTPGTGGMSVAPRTPSNLPGHRRPSEWGGTGKDPVWGIDEDKLRPDLRLVPDSPSHGTIQPIREMTWEEYLDALWRTRADWSKR